MEELIIFGLKFMSVISTAYILYALWDMFKLMAKNTDVNLTFKPIDIFRMTIYAMSIYSWFL